MAVARKTQVIASSKESFQDAVNIAISRASKTLHASHQCTSVIRRVDEHGAIQPTCWLDVSPRDPYAYPSRFPPALFGSARFGLNEPRILRGC